MMVVVDCTGAVHAWDHTSAFAHKLQAIHMLNNGYGQKGLAMEVSVSMMWQYIREGKGKSWGW